LQSLTIGRLALPLTGCRGEYPASSPLLTRRKPAAIGVEKTAFGGFAGEAAHGAKTQIAGGGRLTPKC
jgi:hypothetical protein